MQVVDLEELAGVAPRGADGAAVVGEDLLAGSRHRLNDPHGFVRQVAPDVVADLLARVLHIPHQHPLAGHIQISPADAGDLFLSAGRVDGEGDHFRHMNGTGLPAQQLEEMGQDLVQLFRGRPASALLALADDAELLQHHPRITHRMRVDVITPGRLGHRHHGGQMRQVVPHGLRLNATALGAGTPLGELHQLLARQVAVRHITEPGVPAGLEGTALGLAERPDALVLVQVAVDDVSQQFALAIGPFDGTGQRQLRFPLGRPRLGRLLAVEGLAFLINLLAIAHDPNLRRIAERSVLAFPLPDRCHFELVHEV
ncbi:hypothetical protein D9M70_478970 [compost metagenome]